MSWIQPQCDNCWVLENGAREASRITPDPETCCTCGTLTLSGIYIRRNPLECRYPQEV